MRNMSFYHTKQQILDETKTETCRKNCNHKVGDLVCAVEKCQGIPKGKHIKRLKIIRIIWIRYERLSLTKNRNVNAEGFLGKSVEWFINLYLKINGIKELIDPMVYRICFEYVRNY